MALVKQKKTIPTVFGQIQPKKNSPKNSPNQRLLLNRQSSLDFLRIVKVLNTLSYLDIVFASMNQALHIPLRYICCTNKNVATLV
jgi:hypothetical protein